MDGWKFGETTIFFHQLWLPWSHPTHRHCWWLKSGVHQLSLVVEIPFFTTGFSYIPRLSGMGYLNHPTVSWMSVFLDHFGRTGDFGGIIRPLLKEVTRIGRDDTDTSIFWLSYMVICCSFLNDLTYCHHPSTNVTNGYSADIQLLTQTISISNPSNKIH